MPTADASEKPISTRDSVAPACWNMLPSASMA